ncbi:Asparagine-rich zinc finger protein AZF1 [Frankliniella fusca]|uniref:Asparagine-rich zinc finger protein AZF1 n=1 Tax=Frankliniella fusca TaxID=407009 RepID=A0AAE1GSJ2_9NEOP|nr:Asparagine-rich zinc finger protein AZF1 [Frankliniella fusca]
MEFSDEGSLSDDAFIPKKKSKVSEKSSTNPDASHDLFICLYCSSKFASKDNLRRHIKKCKKNPDFEEELFLCIKCESSFSRKDNLSVHMKTCEQTKKKKISCLMKGCSKQFWQKVALIEHLKRDHEKIIQTVQKLTFSSKAEFIAWKEQEEERTFSYFSQDSGQKGSRVYYYCQHDGSDRAHRKKGEPGRKTSRKNSIGQIKKGAVCIAKIAEIVSDSGSRAVEYYSTHNHILSPHDFAHQPPSTATNIAINNQIALGVSATEILHSIQSPALERDNRDDCNAVGKDLIITTRRIKQRIAKRRNSLRHHPDDKMSVFLLVETLQKEKYNPVIIFKPSGMDIVVGPKDFLLNQEHFLLGIQTKAQRELLVEHSGKIVVVDDTHNVTQYENVTLLNMMVVDQNNRGWCNAHLITNSMYDKNIEVFVRAIKKRSEEMGDILEFNCVITDDAPALINGIEAGMGKTMKHILCQWHLDKTFKDQIREKVPRRLSDSVYTDLKVVIGSKPETEFIQIFEALQNKYSSDCMVFVKYLKQYYVERKEKWAMCYRQQLRHGNINTTAHVESFHNRLKKEYFKRVPNKRMDDLVNILLTIDKDDYASRLREAILGFKMAPHAMRQRHENGISIPDESLSEILSSVMWSIESTSKKNEFYCISKTQDVCSKDLCFDKCPSPSCHGLCSHLYVCSCPDSRNPLCKHIHKLHSFLQRNVPNPAYQDLCEEVQFVTIDTNDFPEVLKDFSEANAYHRLECNMSKLTQFISQRSLPKHLVLSCDTEIDKIVKKISVLSVQPEPEVSDMPAKKSIAPRQKLVTQLAQMLPSKRRKKKKKTVEMKCDIEEKMSKREDAKSNLLSLAPPVPNLNNLKDVILTIGNIYKLTKMDLLSLSLDITQTEEAFYRRVDRTFHKGWLTSDIINAFIFNLAQTDDSVFAGASELSLSMARGNLLKRIFSEVDPVKKIYIFPANFTDDHWTMFAVKVDTAEILYLDPMKKEMSSSAFSCAETMISILKTMHPSISKWSLKVMTYCTQIDSLNCGVHVCWFAHQIIMKVEEITDLEDIKSYRQFIHDAICGNCLERSTDINICAVCASPGVDENNNVSVRCSRCDRLYHASCIENYDDNLCEDFVCPSTRSHSN